MDEQVSIDAQDLINQLSSKGMQIATLQAKLAGGDANV